MILELSVENLAIIERAHIQLGPGFTALTGETGAGKSLLIDAIELALGERADTDQVRTGATKATVHLAVDLAHAPNVRAAAANIGAEPEDGTLYIQREVYAEGRSQVRINGRLAPVGALRQLGRSIVDLHGQHSHQSLMHPETHAGFLDAWIGGAAVAALDSVRTAHSGWREADSKLAAFRRGVRDRAQRIDLLTYQIEEIESVNPVAGEFEELGARIERLRHSERITESIRQALAALTDEEGNAIDRLGEAVAGVDAAFRFDPGLAEIDARVRALQEAANETVFELRDYAESLESDPSLLEQLAARQDDLKRLRRKYGEDESAILEHLAAARQELDLLVDGDESEERLVAREAEARAEYDAACAELTRVRTEHAEPFAAAVRSHLEDLAMERARFSIRVLPRTADAEGADDVAFLFSANAGEEPRPLAKIASGGEISRVMLAIKSVMAGTSGVPTLIFDEVDAGLGGRAAAAVARKLEQLASHYQVVVISHSPQIAARATRHFRIQKSEHNGRVATRVVELGREDREEEIARMLAGDAVTDAALANARELLNA